MKSKEELDALKVESLKHVTGGVDDGPKWSTVPCGDCMEICYNPKCIHFGHFVSKLAGPVVSPVSMYCVCEFCGSLLTTPEGDPVPFGI